jgi:hypothetical protein
MKRNLTTYIGVLFILVSLSLFTLYLVMAFQHKEALGLKSYYIWGSAAVGLTLVVMPQEKIVQLIFDFWEAIIKKITK